MVFSSYIFLFLFLPVTLGGYFLIPQKNIRIRNLWLLLASLVFYGWNGPKYLLLLITSIALNWGGSYLITVVSRKKAVLAGTITANILLLMFFKYANFIISNIALFYPQVQDSWTQIVLPLGISFFTFQGMSYVIDVYRGDTELFRNPLDVALYISMFPQLVAGPIVRSKDIFLEIRNRTITSFDTGYGFRRFVYGLSKKILLADTFGKIADEIFNNAGSWNTGSCWIGIIAYTLQIYYDFSGYSDMAIGLGSIMGFHFSENFNYPYVSKSVTEFWRRWHISLSSWFRDYVYIPCGGNRVSPKRHLFNIMLVWLLTGIWHGANWTFICWGIYYGLLLLIEKFILKKAMEKVPKPLCWMITMLLVMIGWVLFRSDTLALAGKYLLEMFRIPAEPESGIVFLRYLTNYMVWIAAGLIGMFPVKNMLAKIRNRYPLRGPLLSALENIYILFLFAFSVIVLISGNYNAFIYFQF